MQMLTNWDWLLWSVSHGSTMCLTPCWSCGHPPSTECGRVPGSPPGQLSHTWRWSPSCPSGLAAGIPSFPPLSGSSHRLRVEEKKSLVMVLIFLILLQLKAKAEEPSLESAWWFVITSKWLSSKCKAQEVCIFMWSPSTMLVLAKKPDEVFKAPLNTKKQAPVTARNREKQAGVSGASLPDPRHRSHVSASGPLRGWWWMLMACVW